MINYNNIIKFWFQEDVKPFWFVQNNNFDRKIRGKFSKYYINFTQEQINNELSSYDYLSIILLYNAFPKKIFRNTCFSFAHDKIAKNLAKQLIDKSMDLNFNEDEKTFCYLPFATSENIEDQNYASYLYKEINNSQIIKQIELNKNIIQEYGRFPQRNIIFGRKSSVAEEAFLTNNYYKLMQEYNLDLF